MSDAEWTAILAKATRQTFLMERIGPSVPLCIFLHCAGLAGLDLESVLLLKLPELAMMGLAMRFLVCSTRL